MNLSPQRKWFYIGSLLFLLLGFIASARLQAAPMTQAQLAPHYGLSCAGQVSFNDITAIENFSSENEVLTQISGQTQLKTAGKLVWAEIRLKRSTDASIAAWNWRKEVINGNIETARRSCSIYLFDKDGKTVAQWDVTRVWPAALQYVSVQKADGTSVEQEQLLLAHEGFTRVATFEIANDSFLPVASR